VEKDTARGVYGVKKGLRSWELYRNEDSDKGWVKVIRKMMTGKRGDVASPREDDFSYRVETLFHRGWRSGKGKTGKIHRNLDMKLWGGLLTCKTKKESRIVVPPLLRKGGVAETSGEIIAATVIPPGS